MSTETTNKKIKIDNGTTFGKTYTDKAIDSKEEALNNAIPTDIGVKDGKLGLLHDTKWLTNQGAIGLGSGLTYDSTKNEISASGGGNIYKLDITKIFSNSESIEIINSLRTASSKETLNTKVLQNVYKLDDFNSSITAIALDLSELTANLNDIVYMNCGINSETLAINCSISFWVATGNVDNLVTFALDIHYNSSGKYYYLQGYLIYKSGIVPAIKQISLFGNHSILVPSDSSDSNIDLYTHNIVMKDADSNTQKQLFITITSSSNLVCDSFTDLNTLLGTTKRTMPCSGFEAPTTSGCPCIQALDWQGTYASSKYITNSASTGSLGDFKVIKDDVTTL